HQLARLGNRTRVGRADDGGDRRETVLADEVGPPLVDERGDVLPQHAAVGEAYVLDVAAGVRRLDDAEEPCALAPCGGEERLERLPPKVRVDGERIGDRLLALEVGGRVRA